MDQTNLAQTKIIERDLERLSERFDRHLEIYASNGKELAGVKAQLLVMNNNINAFTTEQATQWAKIEKNADEIDAIEINVNSLAMKIGIYATFGSTAASATVVYIIQKILA